MSIQTQLKRTEWTPVKCICNNEARAYRSDEGYHVECNPCGIFTPVLSNIHRATHTFQMLADVVRHDRAPVGTVTIAPRFTRDWNKQ